MKAWTKAGREKYAAHRGKEALAAACGVSRQSLSGYAYSEPKDAKAVQTPARVAAVLAEQLKVGAHNFGQKKVKP